MELFPSFLLDGLLVSGVGRISLSVQSAEEMNYIRMRIGTKKANSAAAGI